VVRINQSLRGDEGNNCQYSDGGFRDSLGKSGACCANLEIQGWRFSIRQHLARVHQVERIQRRFQAAHDV